MITKNSHKILNLYFVPGRAARRCIATAAEGGAVLAVRLHHRLLHAQGRVRQARHAHPHQAASKQTRQPKQHILVYLD